MSIMNIGVKKNPQQNASTIEIFIKKEGWFYNWNQYNLTYGQNKAENQ